MPHRSDAMTWSEAAVALFTCGIITFLLLV